MEAPHSGEYSVVVGKPPTAGDDVLVSAEDAIRLLGAARMVLDRCAEGKWASATEARDLSQRIVDVIGHGVTDEPPWLYLVCQRIRAGWLPHRLTASRSWWWGRPRDPEGFRLWSEGLVPAMVVVEKMEPQEIAAWRCTLHPMAQELGGEGIE